jgi:hypothetical protein
VKVPRARHLRLVPLFAFGGAVVAAVACYGPTEVVVDLSTDLDCGASIRTAVYKGEPFRTTPETETTTCASGAGTSEIGTLTILPSGSDDGDAAIKAVLAIGGKDPTTCDADPANCIVATRSFSFVAHTTRRLPIVLSQECLGKKCPDGQTCGAGGACISNAVTCGGGGCSLPGESDGGARKRDAGDEGGGGGPGPDAGSPCGEFGAPPVVQGVLVPVVSASSGDAIYFANKLAVSSVTRSASDAPGQVTVTQVTTVDGPISALGAQANTLAIGYVAGGVTWVRILPVAGAASATPGTPRQVKVPAPVPSTAAVPVVAFGRDGGSQLLIATINGIYTLGPNDQVPTLVSSHVVHEIASTVDAANRVATVYALEADGGIAYYADAGLSGEPKIILSTAPPTSVLHAFSALAYAAVPPPPAGPTNVPSTFYQIDRGSLSKVPNFTEQLSAFALDGTYVYGASDGVTLGRWDLATATPTVLEKSNDPITHVFVDNVCAYYWATAPTGAALYVRPKSK